MILAVCPNPAIDRTSETVLSSPAKIRELKKTTYSAGGKGINVARALKKLGGAVITAGMAGGFSGRFFESLLAEEGMKGFFVSIENPTRLNATLLDPGSGKELHMVDEGPRVSPGERRKFRALFDEILSGNDIKCAVFSGSLPPGCPPGFYRELIKAARKKGIKTALDSSGAALECGLGAKPDFVKPNLAELEELAGGKLATMKEKKKFAAGLGATETIVSMGSRGAFVSAEGFFTSTRGRAAFASSSVGSGDALLAGYLFSRLLRGKTVEESLLLGSACALASLESRLPGDFPAWKVRRFLDETAARREKV